MIPKIIHYCWFGRGEKPPLAQKCLASWRKFCPDFEIKEWDEDNFALSAAPLYVRQAYEAGRWAFVTDYVRLLALTQEGGVYLDTDVELVKPLTPYLQHRAFAGFERDDSVQTGLLASEPEFPLFREFLDYYDTAVFYRADGTQDTTTNVEVLTRLCLAHGLRPDGTRQSVAGLEIYPKEVFCPVEFGTMHLHRTRSTVCIHWFAASWHTQQEREQLEAEQRQRRAEQASERRYALGTRLLGEAGYARLKSWLKGGG